MATQIIQLMLGHVEVQPSNMAIQHSETSITYLQLQTTITSLGEVFRDRGIRPGDKIPVLTTRCIEGLVCMIALLAIGACYVPIDTESWSEERISSTIQALRPRVLVSTSDAGYKGLPTILIPDVSRYTRSACNEHQQCPPAYNQGHNPDALAYVIFTSGTTGSPKGVMISAESLLHYVLQKPFNLSVNQDDRVIMIMSVAFDACTCILFSTLCNGGTVVLSSPSTFLQDAMACTILPMTPSLLKMMNSPDSYRSVRAIFLGGEPPDPELVDLWSSDKRRLYNSYGATETTCTSLMAELISGMHVHLGNIIPGSELFVLDDEMRESPDGELVISGKSLALGYYNDRTRTNERFVSWNGRRVYRTGDHVRSTAGGLVFVGRRDALVKNRGFLVNLNSQVVPALRIHPDVEEAVAFMHNSKLLAFITPTSADGFDVRRWLSNRLDVDPFIIPDEIRSIAVIPLTANGKVDQAALARHLEDTPSKPNGTTNFSKNRNMEILETSLAKTLGCSTQALRQDLSFWDMGGNSLLAIRLFSVLHQHGLTITTNALFHSANIVEICAKLSLLGPRIELQAVKANNTLPATTQQLSMLRSSVYCPPSSHVLANITIKHAHSSFSARRLKEAWQQALDRHDTFGVVVDIGEGSQTFGPFKINWSETTTNDATTYSSKVKETSSLMLTSISGASQDHIVEPTNLFHLITNAGVESTLVWLVHHSLIDGWSIGIIVDEVDTLLRGYLAGPVAPFASYIENISNYMTDYRPSAKHYWASALQEHLSCPPLHIVHQEKAVDHGFRSSSIIALGMSKEQLVINARDLHVSHSSVIYGAWAILLSQYTSSPRVVFGAVMSGRTFPMHGVEHVVGPLINTCPLPVLVEDQRILKFLGQVQAKHLEITDFQWDVASVLGEVYPEHVATLFDTIVAIECDLPDSTRPTTLGDWQCSISRQDFPEFNLTLFIEAENEVLTARAVYDPAAFPPFVVERVLQHFRYLLCGLLESSNRASNLHGVCANMLDPEELMTLTDINGGLLLQGDPSVDVLSLFHAACSNWPDLAAVEGPATTMTYAQLADLSSRIAYALASIVSPSDVVAVLSDGSIEWVATILAVMKAGAVYAPIDIALPHARKEFMLKRSKAVLCVALRGGPETMSTVHDIPMLCLSTLALPSPSHRALSTSIDPDMPAYLIFTSGSTGEPKPVQLSHGGLASYLSNPAARLWARPGRRHAQMYSVGFDVSVAEVLGTICFGATLVLKDPSDPIAHLSSVDVAMFTPSFLSTLNPTDFPNLDAVLLAGEMVTQALADRWSSIVRLYNGYGPCEATIICLMAHLTPGKPVTIGSPVPGMRVYLLDADQQPVPVGIIGEICISGTQVADGYFDAPEKTTFMPDPFHPGQRMYRTGDLGVWTQTMEIIFMGRKDHQVKVRGFRVELAEVEAGMFSAGEGVKQAAVILSDDGSSIVGFASPDTVDPVLIKSKLAATLPAHAVPSVIHVMDELPMTGNQKIDRQKLASLSSALASTSLHIMPDDLVTDMEVLVAEAWRKVLGLPTGQVLYRSDDFLALGGHSLRQVGLVQQLSQLLHKKIPLRLILRHKSLSNLASALAELEASYLPATKPSFVNWTPEQEYHELSHLEEEMLALHLESPKPSALNIGLRVEFEGDVDAGYLEAAVNYVLGQHDIFRTTYSPDDVMRKTSKRRLLPDSPRAKLRPILGPQVVDLESTIDEAMSFHEHLVEAELRDETWRVVLVLKLHHIIADLHTIRLLVRQIKDIYQHFTNTEKGDDGVLPHPSKTRNYSEWALWSKQHDMPRLEDQAYWSRYLANGPPRPFSAAEAHMGETANFSSIVIATPAHSPSQESMVAAVAAAIHSVTQLEDIVIAISHMDRSEPGTEDMLGLFLERIPIRVSLPRASSRSSLVTRIRDDIDACLSHAIPYREICGAVGSTEPLFDAMVTFHRRETKVDALILGVRVKESVLRNKKASIFPVLVEAFELEDGVRFELSYQTQWIRDAQVELMLEVMREFTIGCWKL